MSQAELQRLFGAAAQLFQQRRFAEAAAVFRRATEIAPASAAAWCNLAAALVELRESAPALAAADRAIALAPELAAAHANRGDALRLGRHPLATTAQAYRRAAELQPRSPDLLNKLGTTLQAMTELDEAERAFTQALAVAPAYRLARLNYGCLLIQQGRSVQARALALDGLAHAGADESARREWADALDIIDRNAALAPLLRRALAARAPREFLDGAVAHAPSARPCDQTLAVCVSGCVRTLPAESSSHARIDGLPDELSDMLEAHFSAHLGEDEPTARSTVAFLRAHGASERLPDSTGASLLDAHSYYRAIAHYRSPGGRPGCDAQTVVAWLRYWHAFLTSHRPEVAPGQLKAFPNSVIINPDVERTAPGLVQGTLEYALREGYARIPPGAARAALVYYVLADVHPFADGNGRLGRFLMNRELEAAHLAPVLTPKALKPPFSRALTAIRRQHDLGPFVAWLATSDAYTREFRGAFRGG